MSKRKSNLIDIDDLNKSPEVIGEKHSIPIDDNNIVDTDDDVGTIDAPPDDAMERRRKELMANPIELSPSETFESLSKNNSKVVGEKIDSYSHPSGQNTLFPNEYTLRKDRPKSKRRCQIPPYPLDLLPAKDPNAPKITYPQDAVATNMAKTNEEMMIENMIWELLMIAVEEPERKHTAGRIGFSLREKLFFMFVMAYNKCDSRKTISKLKKFCKYKQISRYPSFKSIFNFYADKKLSKILDDLILISALPLTHIEDTGAIDSTGFSTSRFDNWNKYKWTSEEGKNERKQSE
jgi:hypothetical protein